MESIAGYAPQDILKAVIAGFVGLVAVSCGIALLLDAIRWMAGDKRDDPDREGVASLVRSFRDKAVIAVAVGAIAGSGALFATLSGASVGSQPTYLISDRGPTGWMVEGTAAGSTTTMGEALNQVAEATRGQTFEGQVQQDYENRVGEGTSALAGAAESALSGDVAGAFGSGFGAALSYTGALLEDMWLGDNAAGIRNLLTGNLLGTSVNGWREIANWVSTYEDSYQEVLRQIGAG